jgi:hypothetical protein
MEAASVHAFEDLARELEAFGAPRSLSRRALIAARDEARHARVVGRLAGGTPTVRQRKLPPRGLVAFAVENARAGCVLETFAALEARHAATIATDAAFRRRMGPIARDEARHAELAYAVDAWARTALSPRERVRLDRAHAAAWAGLLRVGDAPAIPELGILGGRARRALAEELVRALR